MYFKKDFVYFLGTPISLKTFQSVFLPIPRKENIKKTC